MKKIYKYYKDRLVEISGRSRSLYSKKVSKKTSFDIGKILYSDYEAIEDFSDFLFSKKRTTFPLIDKHSRDRICKNLKIEDKVESQFRNKRPMKKDESAEETTRRVRIKRNEETHAITGQVNDLKLLKREIEEFGQETGRQELFIGYPFVEGSIGRDMVVRAPLLLFPASIHIENENTAYLELRPNEPIQLNKVFVLAYAQKFNLDLENIITDFDNLQDYKLKDIDCVIDYLRNFGFKMGHPQRKGIFHFPTKDVYLGESLEVKHYAVIGRFPLANAIYNDYKLLENRKTTDGIRDLLESRDAKLIKKPNTDLYAISSLDFAQEEAIEKLNQHGNMVIYGPPGTGKSQTIVNIITDALCKNKRVLVVSQKKAALDVVYNRLGALNDRAMYITDPEKNKADFFTRTKNAHLALMGDTTPKGNGTLDAKYRQIKQSIEQEVALLQSISDTLFVPTHFGLSLQEMYAKSNIFGKTAFERNLYQKLLSSPTIMSFKYYELENLVRVISEKRKDELYYKGLEYTHKNSLIDHIRTDLDVNTLNTAKSLIDKILLKRKVIPFDMSKYPNARHLLAFYLENGLSGEHDLRPLAKFVAKLEGKTIKEILENFEKAMQGFQSYLGAYSMLAQTMDTQGFAMTLEGLINGNLSFLKMLQEALADYVFVRDININMQEMTVAERVVLDFCYRSTKGIKEFKEAIQKLLQARIYHEIIDAEERCKHKLAKIMDYESIKDRILSLKNDQKEIVRAICFEMFKTSYVNLYNSTPENKNFLYQINKDQKLWTIRKLMEVYQDLMLTLFPCWLLSPESVSTILPLEQGLFDLVLFDEASQVFIENTLPTIYRAKHIAVAGDNKQLRPTALFMRRYMGADIDDLDLSTQAALEVESLLDLATSRFSSINLNYHYRSKNEELITFSNFAFYDCKLQIAPNLSKNVNSKPIERIKVAGTWLDRKNKAEAAQVIILLKKIFRTRKEKETIGIITFNAEQENYIEDLIDKECMRDEKFRDDIAREKDRKIDGENVGLFIKNLENVQGDERDIIIFSIGYAKNEYGKVISHFGSLNMEGGENRLNVAITRAKKKIYIVTSIEPEELNIDGTKNAGPKIFKKYLQYVRAVSTGNTTEVTQILESFHTHEQTNATTTGELVVEVKKALEKLGHSVEINVGTNSYKLSLAIYDKKSDKYLLGIEFDDAAFRSSPSVVERDVFRVSFMESRGWTIMRVYTRDWWLDKAKVIAKIDRAISKAKKTSLSV